MRCNLKNTSDNERFISTNIRLDNTGSKKNSKIYLLVKKQMLHDSSAAGSLPL